ncbi:MAG: HD domain-containing protein [Bryobacteraceae bacterium]|jgi:[protein-PII] uridylyltransferase
MPPCKDPILALAERTALVDGMVQRSAGDKLWPAFPAGLTLLAVGGYGRRHLFPYSDVDLLLLVESGRLAQEAAAPISAFLQTLWDSGLRLSHSVRTPEECAEIHDQNIELNVSLLDQRYLAGDRALYARFAERLPRFLHAQRDPLMRNLTRLARERHQKYQNTFYHLEPNVKDTPGGMRDYQLVRWLAQIRSVEAPRTEPAFLFMARLRCFLHSRSGRDNNALTFDAQEEAAEYFAAPGTAQWMRDYFRHARDLYRAAVRELELSEAQSSSLFAQFKDWRTRLSNADFSVARERVHVRAPHALEADPELALRLFQFVARHGIRPSTETEQRVAAVAPQLAEWFSTPRQVWPAIEEILSLPYAADAVRSMHDTGVLRAIFPEMAQIECLVIRDFYHRYTVDEHTLVTLQVLEGLRGSREPAVKRYTDLLSEMEAPALLLCALLFHDVGKGAGNGAHAEASVRAAGPAMERIGMPRPERDLVIFLIRRHLEMSAVMNSRDLQDPATARDMAGRVETVERLKALTLMTYADISAVNPSAMTPWRAEVLWQLYLLTYNELTRELATDRIPSAIAAAPEKRAFLAGLPMRYARTHTAEEIDAHLVLDGLFRQRGVAVALEKVEAAWRLTLVTGDRPFLFASVAGTLSSFGMNILKAEAFSNDQGTVLDTFTFADPMRALELNPSEIDRLRVTVERVVLGRADVRELLRNRPKSGPPSRNAQVQPTVSFNAEASDSATLIEIMAQDRPGLLYDLAAAISAEECNIEVVLIDTEAHKAIDVFYVTAGGGKPEGERLEKLGEALRLACGG